MKFENVSANREWSVTHTYTHTYVLHIDKYIVIPVATRKKTIKEDINKNYK